MKKIPCQLLLAFAVGSLPRGAPTVKTTASPPLGLPPDIYALEGVMKSGENFQHPEILGFQD